jgi:L-ascorbate metabolism protein UlaG (beta-lactamase superfamily)
VSDHVRWLGHATVEVALGGATVLTDPVLRARVGHLVRVGGAGAVPTAPARLDAIALSHAHRDHLDVPTLRALGGHAPLIVPRGTGRTLPRALRARAAEVVVGDAVVVGAATVRAVPARHDGRRHPVGSRARAADALGYVVEGAGKRVYFAGDTDLFDGMARVGADGLDVALLPVWGWGPSIGPGHLDPERAARAAALLAPRFAVPIHWATFLPAGQRRRHGGLLTTPGPAFAAATARAAPDVRVALLAPGGTLAL